MKSATEQLREELFDTLHRLKTGQIDAATAQAVSKIGGNIIATVAVEIQAAAELERLMQEKAELRAENARAARFAASKINLGVKK